MISINWKSGIKILTLLILVPLFLISLTTRVNAESAAEKLSEIKEKLKTKMLEVVQAKEEEKSLGSSIEKINDNVSKTQKELKSYDKRIHKTERTINELSEEISLLSKDLEGRQHSIEEYVRALYKRQNNNNALILVSADDYQDLIRKSKYISLVAYHNSQVLNSYKQELHAITERKGKLDSMREEIEITKNRIQRKKEKMQSERNKKNELLAAVQARRATHEKKIQELEKSSKRLHSMIAELKTKSIPSSLIGDGFKSAKGNLPWPLNGDVISPYGEYLDTELNVKTFSNGIEIKAEEGDMSRSIAGGRVVYASNFDGMGMIVIIDHGSGYHSLYGNLSEVSLNKGDLLIAGFDIGKVGISKNSNVPALYFEIRYKGKPVDPMEWIAQRGEG